MKFTIGEDRKSRMFIAYKAVEAIMGSLKATKDYSVDPANRYWAPQSLRTPKGITPYEMRLVALVNTHEKHWRCDMAIVRPIGNVPSDCSPTLVDPIQYQFF